MANILAIKRRVQTAQNVSKTTKAMQMIATSKLKRAQDAAISSRPYVDKLTFLTRGLTDRLDKENLSEYMKTQNQNNNKLLIIISPDKGLCGGLITNLLKELIQFDSSVKDTRYITIGKKTENTVVKLGKEVIASFDFGTTLPIFETVYPIARIIDEQFLTKKISEVNILYTNFSSVFSQIPQISTLLPIKLPTFDILAEKKNDKEKQAVQKSITLFEPNPDELLPSLLVHYLEMALFQYLLESYASEQAARMISMKNATENAQDIIEYLKLEYNKERQEQITNEILDIGGATAALAYE